MKFKYVLIISIPFVFSACATFDRLQRALSPNDPVQVTRDSLRVIANNLARELNTLRPELQKKDARIKAVEKTLDSLRSRFNHLQNDFENLSKLYEQSKLNNSSEIKKLLTSLETLKKEIGQREEKLLQAEKDLQLRDSLLTLKNKRVNDLEKMLRLRDSSLTALKTRLNDALLGFTNSGLSVNIKNGNIYISLSNQLLFSTGKTDIDKQGKDALIQVAKVLNTLPDLSISVEGHTDNQPINNLGSIKDNWDLSVLRSTEVVRYITGEGKLDAKRISASGRGEYMPLDNGNTTEARAKNRRIEIILIPKLAELFDIIQK